MSDHQIRKMIMDLLTHADYDLAKSFDPKLSEDVEQSESEMKVLIEIARGHIEDAEDTHVRSSCLSDQ